MQNILLVSDLHFDCANLVRNTRTRFGSVEEHDEHLIARCNAKAKRGDRLIIIGDLCRNNPAKWRNRLVCKNIRFVKGNHDTKAQIERAFGRCDYELTIKIPEGKLWCKHYPTAFWEGSHKGWYHAYGHVHARYEDWLDRAFPGRRSIDVSVDNAAKLLGDYEPFHIDEIMAFLRDRPGHEIIPQEERWAEKDYH